MGKVEAQVLLFRGVEHPPDIDVIEVWREVAKVKLKTIVVLGILEDGTLYLDMPNSMSRLDFESLLSRSQAESATAWGGKPRGGGRGGSKT